MAWLGVRLITPPMTAVLQALREWGERGRGEGL